MQEEANAPALARIVLAQNEAPMFAVGDPVRVLTRQPIGHYRVPIYLRGKNGTVKSVIEPAAVDNEQEGFGRNAGRRRHYYRVAFAMAEIWPDYAGATGDGLWIEIFETWLQRT